MWVDDDPVPATSPQAEAAVDVTAGTPPADVPAAGEPAGAEPGKPHRRRRRLLLVTGAVIGALVLVTGMVLGGIAGLTYYWKHGQRTSYDAGHAAYLRADCRAAITEYTRSLEHHPDQRITNLARQERDECQELVSVLDRVAGLDPGKAIEVNLDFIAGTRADVLRPPAKQQVVRLVTDASPKQFVNALLCGRLAEIEKIVGKGAKKSEWLPPVLLSCGRDREKAKLDVPAEDLYKRLRKEFPKSSQATKATAGLIRIKFARAKANKAKKFSQPRQIGSFSSSNGDARLHYQNCMPRKIELMFLGPETLTRPVKKCATCKEFRSEEAARNARCTGAPEVTISLKPGTYKVVIVDGPEYNQGVVYGVWTFRRGVAYGAGILALVPDA